MSEAITLCDVAKEHLLPWLAGRLDGTAEGEAFEAHVRECKACSALVADRRRAMQALLALAEEGGSASGQVTPQVERPKQIQPASWRALVQSKGTAILTVAAALLLVVSYLAKPGEGLLGEKALPSEPEAGASQPSTGTNTQATETAHSVKATAEGETESARATQEQPGEKALAENPAQPSPQTEREEQPATRKASSKRRTAPPVKTAPAPSKSNKRNAGRVEVFDESGRLIGSASIGGQK